MSISTYAELQTAVAGWLHRSDMAAQAPDFIALAEARIARDLRLRGQVASVVIPCVAGTRAVAQPTDFLEAENMTITVSGFKQSLTYVTSETADVRMPDGAGTGSPAFFSISGLNFMLAPTPDSDYSLNLDYYARIAALSVSAPTNFLLTAAPGVYLFGALAEAAPFMMDDQRAIMWEGKYRAECAALELADEQATRSGGSMRVRVL